MCATVVCSAAKFCSVNASIPNLSMIGPWSKRNEYTASLALPVDGIKQTIFQNRRGYLIGPPPKSADGSSPASIGPANIVDRCDSSSPSCSATYRSNMPHIPFNPLYSLFLGDSWLNSSCCGVQLVQWY